MIQKGDAGDDVIELILMHRRLSQHKQGIADLAMRPCRQPAVEHFGAVSDKFERNQVLCEPVGLKKPRPVPSEFRYATA